MKTEHYLKAIQSSKFIIYAFSLKSRNNRDPRIKFSSQPINIGWPTCVFYLLFVNFLSNQNFRRQYNGIKKGDSICTTNCLFFVKTNCLVSFKSYKSLSTHFLTTLIVSASKLISTKHQLAFTLSNQYLMHHNHPIRIN